MTLPVQTVEIAFNSGWATPAASRIWTDVTSYVEAQEGADITRGRPDEQSTATPSQLSLTLNNTDGRFTPEVARTNIETNPGVEVNTTNWLQHSGGVTSVTWARQSGWAYEGTYSMRQTGTSGTITLPNGLKGYIGSLVADGGFAYPVSAGQTWTARAVANVLTVPNGVGDPGLWAEIFYFDAALTLLTQNNGTSIYQTVPLGVQSVSVTATAPATAAWMQVVFVMGTLQNSSVMDWYVDSVRVEQAAAPVSPYYPYVRIGRPVRIRSTFNAVTYSEVLGYIDEWPVSWPGGSDKQAYVGITATSRTSRLGNKVPLKSIVEQEFLLDDPESDYTLAETAGSAQANDLSGNDAAALSQSGSGTAVVFGSATGPSTDGLTAAQFTNGGKSLQALTPQGPLAAGASAFALECFFSATAVGASGGLLVDAITAQLGIDATGNLFVQGTPGGAATSGPSYLDGNTHHVFGYYNGANMIIYADDALAATNAVTGAMTVYPINGIGVSGASGAFVTGLRGGTITGTIAHAALYLTVPSPTRIAAHANAGLTGFAGETVTARLTRYASYAGVAAAECSFETGQVPDLAHIDTTGVTALEMMRKIEATEEGVLFDGKDGTLTFHDRSHRYGGASAFTLDASSQHVQPDLNPRQDDFGLINDVTATSTDGTVKGRVFSQPSIDDHGPRRDDREVATTDLEEPFQHASWLVNSYKDPRTRVPTVTVNLHELTADTALVASLLSADIGTRFTLSNLPVQFGASSAQVYIEGYRKTITDSTYVITFNVSPAAPWDVWTVEDAVLGAITDNPIAF